MKSLIHIVALLLAATSINARALAPRNHCPIDFNYPYEFPHLIINVDSNNPNNAPGTSYFSNVTPSISSLFKFDIPPGDNGKTCCLAFVLPTSDPSLILTSPKKINFSQLNGALNKDTTTWNNKPPELANYGTKTLATGNSYQIASFACPGGQALSFKMKSEEGTTQYYFQKTDGANSIGLYIFKC